ncbi:DNA glycosylase [Bimuria novae-zelandiae CBS 107.79]|uniref:Adenine DNA glycosylase n=1 Tax=Bimuria novae-zelandiae CBS 107.79 TaxID=1447943 RepID=A0A6A5UHE3_9PLEO|nr:DNA glycosylase [Bimuria novae-zelandiae CBS 107.79]
MAKAKTLATRAKPRPKATAKPKPVAPTSFAKPVSPPPPTIPPSRMHAPSYHYPLLLEDKAVCEALLRWFEEIEEARNMPWRKPWLDPAVLAEKEEFGTLLEKRAYEVWVSEVMLQQTRVSTVIPYFTTWITKWPTVHALAAASHDDVLAIWKGLGYYSRATRLYQGAKAVVSNTSPSSPSSHCKIPSEVVALQGIPGIGRYTAGAVSSIAFGEAEPVLDGNVARVLSRQLGLYVDAKDKKSTDVLWEVADQLVKSVVGFPETGRSSVPGQWNQALMELGSTVCTPRPKCEACPIRKTCRVYAEGEILAAKKKQEGGVKDIEDACGLCLQVDTEDLVAVPDEVDTPEDDEEGSGQEMPPKRRKVEKKPANTISNYFTASAAKAAPAVASSNEETKEVADTSSATKRKSPSTTTAQAKAIASYCSLFPKKMPKKKVPEEEAVVCVVEAHYSDGRRKWLIEQRPAKGLLASLWQFPQSTLSSATHTATTRKAAARKFVSTLQIGYLSLREAKHVAELGSLVHVFTHLRLTMHVHHFRVDVDEDGEVERGVEGVKWVETERMGDETLSTGMRRCWDVVVGRG